MSKIYSCRAEFKCDAEQLMVNLLEAKLPLTKFILDHVLVTNQDGSSWHPADEVLIDMRFRAEVPIDMMRGLIGKISDGHRMEQTLQALPLAMNDMRWYQDDAAEVRNQNVRVKAVRHAIEAVGAASQVHQRITHDPHISKHYYDAMTSLGHLQAGEEALMTRLKTLGR